MRVTVLGAGLVGGPMALDLVGGEGFEVTVADIDGAALAALARRAPALSTEEQDLSDPEAVAALARDADLVINAVPGFMGYATLEALIRAGRDVVDIAFCEQDFFGLDELAKERGVVAVVDCGVAPGMSNLLSGHADHQLDETDSVLIYVGGLPEQRRWPWEYKAVFSPIDVIAEYTRPARYVENGRLVVREALSDPELLDFDGIGTLQAFNTDGLRTLARTLDAPNMKEKTLRYPGHIDKIAVLRETGFFDETPVDVGGVEVRPIDLCARLLFPRWKLEDGEVDITVMRIVVEGLREGARTRFTYDLLDRYDETTGVHSMARTTGYTATSMVRLLAAGLYRTPGITPPEILGRHPDCVDFMLRDLAARGVVYRERVDLLD